MRPRRRLVIAALALGLGIAPGTSHAEPQIATGAVEPTPPPSDAPDIDAIGSVRGGLGYSRLLRARILSLSFEDQIQVHRLSRVTVLTAVFGMDAQRPLDAPEDRHGFLATTLGAGLLFHPASGPGFSLSATAAPLWQSKDDKTHLAGFGVGVRGEAYPFYQSLTEAVECKKGAAATYLLSGLHGWVQARRDWIGAGGDSYAVGFGFDLGRQLVLPILGAIIETPCSRGSR